MTAKGLVFLSLFLIAMQTSFGIGFSELMYDPLGADDDLEWIEIYNNDSQAVDMTGWKFVEDATNHNLVAIQGSPVMQPNRYAVIADNPITFLATHNYTGTLFDSTFSLSNTGETIALKNKSGVVMANFTYSYILGGSENGNTLGLYRDDWQETIPTPGSANKIADTCDWSVSFNTDFIFETKTDVAWKILVQKNKGEENIIDIQRSVQDIYGNEIRHYDDLFHNITNKETLSYDPNLGAGTYLLKSSIVPSCNDTNPDNDHDELLIAVKEQPKDPHSSVTIESILDLGSDKEAKFGQMIRVHLSAYRGDTGKETVSVSAEGKDTISKIFTFKVPEKFSTQDLIVPLQLFPNCEDKLKNGSYKIIAEGFDDDDTADIDVAGNDEDVCGKPVKEKAASAKKTPASSAKIEASADSPSSDIPDTESTLFSSPSTPSLFNTQKPYAISTIMFESAQGKAEQLTVYGILGILGSISLFVIASKKPF